MAYTQEQREEYRRNKALTAYDRRTTAQNIIREAYRKAHPTAQHGARDGLVKCGLPIDFGEIAIKLDERGHEYHNHIRCNSWGCPVCAPKMAAKRADEIAQALTKANALGFQAYFLTFTVPHRKSHSTAYVLDKLDECYSKLLQSRKVRGLKSDYGFKGQIKCKDYTFGDNGTHAHLHCIWLFDLDGADLFKVAAELNAALLDKWERLVKNETGRNINRAHGFNLEPIELGGPEADDAEQVARYAAKAISVYMSDGDKDKPSKSPFDLLNSDATEADRAAYLDFYKGQKGRRHILFSRGLKDLLGVEPVEFAPAPSATVAAIGYENAYVLKDERKRQQFETKAAQSVRDALEWLQNETVKQQNELGNRYLGMEFKDNYIVAFSEFVEDWDTMPDERPATVARHQHEQEVEIPAQHAARDGQRDCGPDMPRTHFIVIRPRSAGRSDGDRLGRFMPLYVIEDQMAARMAREHDARRRMEQEREAEMAIYPVLGPVALPPSYKACETDDDRREWLKLHRDGYRERVRERLRDNLAHMAAAPSRPRPPFGPAASLFYTDEEQAAQRPKSGLGKFLDAALPSPSVNVPLAGLMETLAPWEAGGPDFGF